MTSTLTKRLNTVNVHSFILATRCDWFPDASWRSKWSKAAAAPECADWGGVLGWPLLRYGGHSKDITTRPIVKRLRCFFTLWILFCRFNQGLNKSERRSGPGNLSLGSGCKIIGFHSRNLRSWAQQVSNLHYSNPIVNKSFKFHIFTIINSQCWMLFFTNFYKSEKTTWNHA